LIGSNPVNAKEGFKHHVIMRLKLEELEGDKLTELDMDIAKLYYKQLGLDIPTPVTKLAPAVQKEVECENEESSYLQTSDKENKITNPVIRRRLKKKVTFEDISSTGLTVQDADASKVLVRENMRMKAELQNMYILQEENKDLKEELEVYKSITHDERMKVLKEDNESMKVRIGQLLGTIRMLEQRTDDIEAKQSKKSQEVKQKPKTIQFEEIERPQTAQVRTEQGFDPLFSKVEYELDLDIQKMLERNKKQLAELKHDMEEVKNTRPPRKKI